MVQVQGIIVVNRSPEKVPQVAYLSQAIRCPDLIYLRRLKLTKLKKRELEMGL